MIEGESCMAVSMVERRYVHETFGEAKKDQNLVLHGEKSANQIWTSVM